MQKLVTKKDIVGNACDGTSSIGSSSQAAHSEPVDKAKGLFEDSDEESDGRPRVATNGIDPHDEVHKIYEISSESD
jgi:hypothetical protein